MKREARLLWLLIALYAAARVTQAFPDRLPMIGIVAAHVLCPLVFFVVHGSRVYGWRGSLVFLSFCLLFGNVLENLGVATGFPFGHYHFTEVMGPKLFRVPILLGLAYVGMGYLSWVVGGLISGGGIVIRPLVAACAMVAWDLSQDPVWANLVHGWIWHDGGSYFGVPLSNFFGWYLTVYLIYQSFALYLARDSAPSPRVPAAYWRPAVLMYAVSAAGNLFVRPPAGVSVVTDAAGTQWSIHGILMASALVSIFIMGGFAVAAWLRIPATEAEPALPGCWSPIARRAPWSRPPKRAQSPWRPFP